MGTITTEHGILHSIDRYNMNKQISKISDCTKQLSVQRTQLCGIRKRYKTLVYKLYRVQSPENFIASSIVETFGCAFCKEFSVWTLPNVVYLICVVSPSYQVCHCQAFSSVNYFMSLFYISMYSEFVFKLVARTIISALLAMFIYHD